MKKVVFIVVGLMASCYGNRTGGTSLGGSKKVDVTCTSTGGTGLIGSSSKKTDVVATNATVAVASDLVFVTGGGGLVGVSGREKQDVNASYLSNLNSL